MWSSQKWSTGKKLKPWDILTNTAALLALTTFGLMPQLEQVESAQTDLAGLDQKVKEQTVKVRRAEEEVARITAELENLPPLPEGVNEKKAELQKQWRDLDLQVERSFCSALPVSCCAHLAWRA